MNVIQPFRQMGLYCLPVSYDRVDSPLYVSNHLSSLSLYRKISHIAPLTNTYVVKLIRDLCEISTGWVVAISAP